MASSRLGEPSTARSHSLLNAIISASNWSRPRRCSTRPFSYKRLIGSARIALPRDAETSLTLIKHEAIFDALDSGNTFCGHADRIAVPFIEQRARQVHNSVAHYHVDEAQF